MFLFLRYRNLFNTLFSILTGVSPNNVYNYRSITINIFREISDRGFTIGNLVVVSTLITTVKIIVIKKEFTIFEFISN